MMSTGFHTLQARVADARELPDSVRKGDLQRGDWVLVKTKNSTYAICALGDDLYSVSGGWFDRKGVSPSTTTINGCTWGGSAIKHDIVAAPGLFLEFGNKVLTTRIRDIRVIHASEHSYRA